MAVGAGRRRPADSGVTVNAGRIVGVIRPMNGVNNGPLSRRGHVDSSKYYKDMRVHNVRISEPTVTYNDDVMDMNAVFPNEAADPSDPKNYDFAQSDVYIKPIVELGSQITYKLGYSQDRHKPRQKRHIDPPKSYEKWADVAAHIVMHYNQGWADGHHYGIKNWEVWGEPDLGGMGDQVFWTGTPEEYYRLYEVTAKRLKALDPSLRVGGPGLAGSLEYLEGMLKYSRDHKVPIDFVSWHTYLQNPRSVVAKAKQVQGLMETYGYGGAENFLNEWNYGPVEEAKPDLTNWRRIGTDIAFAKAYFKDVQGVKGAAFDAATMILLQDSPVDQASMWQGASTQGWSLFGDYGEPYKAYYAFLAFGKLQDSPQRAAIEPPAREGLTALAGVSADRKTLRVLISDMGPGQNAFPLRFKSLPWRGGARYEVEAVDERADLTSIKTGELSGKAPSIPLATDGPTVLLVTLHPQ